MVRRARSFEVGEWQNSMATSMGGLGLAADAVAGLGEIYGNSFYYFYDTCRSLQWLKMNFRLCGTK